MTDLVEVHVCGSEFEAEAACGVLREAGIRCMHRSIGLSDAVIGGAGEGARAVLVRDEDVSSARELLTG